MTEAFVFTYSLQDGHLPELNSESLSIEPKYHVLTSNHFKLPITMNPLEYGKLIFNMNNNYVVRIDKSLTAKIVVDGDINRVDLLKDGDSVFTYTDKKLSDSSYPL